MSGSTRVSISLLSFVVVGNRRLKIVGTSSAFIIGFNFMPKDSSYRCLRFKVVFSKISAARSNYIRRLAQCFPRCSSKAWHIRDHRANDRLTPSLQVLKDSTAMQQCGIIEFSLKYQP